MSHPVADRIFSPLALAVALVLLVATATMLILVPVLGTVSRGGAEDAISDTAADMAAQVAAAMRQL